MPCNSRRKGKRGELDFAKAVKRALGLKARRTQQYAGNDGAGDVVVEFLEKILFEIKLGKSHNVYRAMEQALAATNSDRPYPVVGHRQDRSEWLVTMRLKDVKMLFDLLHIAMYGMGPDDIDAG